MRAVDVEVDGPNPVLQILWLFFFFIVLFCSFSGTLYILDCASVSSRAGLRTFVQILKLMNPVLSDRMERVSKDIEGCIEERLGWKLGNAGVTMAAGKPEMLRERVTEVLDSIAHRIDEAHRMAMESNNDKLEPLEPLDAEETHGLRNHEKKSTSGDIGGSKGDGFVSHLRDLLNDKPQIYFEDTINNSNARFVPTYNGLRGVDGIDMEVLLRERDESLSANMTPPHPLKEILDRLPEKYTMDQLRPPLKSSELPKTFDETDFMFVDTLDGLLEVERRLRGVAELAVDLEAHNYRSFQGFCCLMQLSTRTEDIIVDAMKLRSHIGPRLGWIFSDPKVVKVLHGADSDVKWLQRDFGIYICNMFDTGIAAKTLDYPFHGLAHLLQTICGFTADKKWQLADWRMRPLPAAAIHYARADTHYLLYCYDILRCELSKLRTTNKEVAVSAVHMNNAIFTVLEASRAVSSKLYEKEITTSESHQKLYERLQPKFGPLTSTQLAVLGAVYQWRDQEARVRDESPGYILPQAVMIKIVKKVPRTVDELMKVIDRRRHFLLTESASELLAMIEHASGTKYTHGEAKKSPKPCEAAKRNRDKYDANDGDVPQVRMMRMEQTLPQQKYSAIQRRRMKARIKSMSSINAYQTLLEPTRSEKQDEQNQSYEYAGETGTAKEERDDLAPKAMIQIRGTLCGASKQGDEQAKIAKARQIENVRTSTKDVMTPEGEVLEEQKGQPFVEEDAILKYGRRTNKKRTSGNRKYTRKKDEMDNLLPEGMFNPHNGLLSSGSKSQRSAVQVRSGNRTFTFK